MFGLDHLPEILILLLVALLVFGPKRMVEMGSQFGKAFREFRDAAKEMSWSTMLGDEGPKSSSASSVPQSQIRRDREAAAAKAHVDAASGIVEGSVEPVEPTHRSTPTSAPMQEPPTP